MPYEWRFLNQTFPNVGLFSPEFKQIISKFGCVG